jgi:serine/threonine protein kinase
MTVVGTPYYMSPEVCENKPYTFKSDWWALGWVLYELCTLQHAFLADNLLGLAYKIVKGTYDPIPDVYSKDLKNLVDKILNKDHVERPSVKDLILLPFLKHKMEEFLKKDGDIGTHDLKIRTIKPPMTEEEKEEEMLKDLTPAQRAKRRKELKAQKEGEKMNQAIKKNMATYGAAKVRKFNEFYDSKAQDELNKEMFSKENYGHKTGGSNKYDQFAVDPNSVTDFDVNDRYEDTYALSNSMGSMGTQISQLTEKPMGSKKFSSHDYRQTREIKGSGSYKFEEDKDDEEYADDFEDATRDLAQLTGVLDNYKKVLSGDVWEFDEEPQKKTPGAFSPISEAPSFDEAEYGTIVSMKNMNERNMLLEYFGDDLYNKMYDYLMYARKKDLDDKIIQSALKEFVGPSNKQALSMWFKLDMIVFKELFSKS